MRQWSFPDSFGRPSVLYDRDGSATTFEYQQLASDGAMAIHVTREGAPKSTVVLDVLGREIRREFDGFDKTLISKTHYNELGRVDLTSRARVNGPQAGDFTQYTYDTGGRPTLVSSPDGTTLEYCYHHNVRCERDQRHFVSCEVYNTHGRVVHRVEPLAAATTPESCGAFAEEVGQAFSPDSDASAQARAQYVTTRYHYYPLGKLRSVSDAAGHVTRFERDDRGELVRNLIHPDSGTWTASYNAFNELEVERAPDGAFSVFHYDTLGRLTERIDEDENRQFTRFTYDIVNGEGYYGELLSTVSADGVEQHFEHNGSGRLSKLTVTQPQTVGPPQLVKHIAYDELKRPSLISYDSVSGDPLSYRIHYNGNGYIAGYYRPDPQSSDPQFDTPLWTAVSTDDFGQLDSLRYGNAVTASRTYYAGNGLLNTETLSNGSELQYLSHGYTPDHRLELFTRRDDATTTSVTRYEYDALKRVKTAVTHDVSESGPVRIGEGYDYDVTGNLLQRKWWDEATVATPRTWTYSYDENARPHAVSRITEGTTFSQFDYQADGSMRERGVGVQPALHIDYNRRHMPFRLVDAAQSVNLAYDAFDYRTRKATPASETLYIDDHFSRRSPRFASGSEERLVVGSEGAAVAEIVRSASGAESVRYLHSDGLGSPLLVTDEGGQVVQRREYEAFGQHSRVTGNISASTRPDFTGQELDTEFGLVNLRARLYDPGTGRFLTVDPLIQPKGGSQRLNPYSYVNNDPVNHTDRSGLCPECAPPPGPSQDPQRPQGPPDPEDPPGPSKDGPTTMECLPGEPCGMVLQTKKKPEVEERTAPTQNIRPAGEVKTSLNGDQIPVLSEHDREVLSARMSMERGVGFNGVLDRAAPLVEDTSQTWRDIADTIFLLESGPGVLKLGVGIIKGGLAAVIPRLGKAGVGVASRAVIAEGKFGYLFGQATGRAHNVARAAENASQLARVGVRNTAEGRALLQAHFDMVVADPSNVVRAFANEHGSFVVRESLFSGPGGFLKFESTWQVLEGGVNRLTTVIPFGGL